MAKISLSAALTGQPINRRLVDGTVPVEGVDLVGSTIHGSEIFWRQLKFQDFDISELSISSLLIALAAGDRTWTALPIFCSRMFFHTSTLVRADSGIEKPEDLKGKRVGVPEYQQTAALWNRGALQHEFGVAPQDMIFYMERPPEKSHGGATGFQAPPGVELHYIPTSTNIGEMLVSGELDATLLYLTDPNLVDRSRIDVSKSSAVRRLYPDPVAEGIRYYKKTGLLPVNHTVVVRTALLEKHPWLALNIYGAYTRAKELMLQEAKTLAAPYEMIGAVGKGAESPFAADPLPLGIVNQRTVLETLAEYSHEQGLTPRRLGLDEVFAKSTLDL